MRHLVFRATGVAIAAVIASAVAGCDSEPATPPAAVDESKLDWGNYPTVPKDPGSSGAEQESVRLAEFVPVPMEIDDKLTARQSGGSITAANPPLGGRSIVKTPGLVAGWETYAIQKGFTSASGLARSAQHSIARFDTGDHAEQAMRLLMADVDPDYPIKGALTVPGYDSAQAVLTYLDGVRVWLVHDNFLIWLSLSDQIAAPEGPGPLLDLAKAFLDRQLALLPNYHPTPADQFETVPADIDGLRARTLPIDAKDSRVGTGIYSAHSALHRQTEPARSQRAFAAAGVDYVTKESALVYRTAGPEQARGLAANFVDELAANYEATDSPPGLPTAKCLRNKDEKATTRFVCFLTYDRYVAEAHAVRQQDVNQQVSAQYKLLAHGQ